MSDPNRIDSGLGNRYGEIHARIGYDTGIASELVHGLHGGRRRRRPVPTAPCRCAAAQLLAPRNHRFLADLPGAGAGGFGSPRRSNRRDKIGAFGR